MQEYRPCPICKGIDADKCECCKGVGKFPYPWILPEDKIIRQPWTKEEDDIVLGASTPMIAYERYCEVYGDSERSLHSVYCHWVYRRKRPIRNSQWSQSEMDILNQALDVHQAVYDYQQEYGEGGIKQFDGNRFSRGRVLLRSTGEHFSVKKQVYGGIQRKHGKHCAYDIRPEQGKCAEPQDYIGQYAKAERRGKDE